ncbi:hypothetical protein SEA_KOZIE_19 [Microbacterium phage Kozie]|uniref:Uncharacterized protein n=1 Tax=Microbacterium phage Kozie TaxID=2885981 RepID=A0AAE8Y7P7_9CAUD|nr:hypothetical protein QC998_gp19 [Microbacterium phage Kozie]UDL16215.1 hypothetical protein SEA_KOZIE_19 [Microbacterium phage Kozie]
MGASTIYRSTWSIDGGTAFDGYEGRSHNNVLHRTRRLFSGQGYRVVKEESRTGHVVLDNGSHRAVIDIIAEHPEATA